MIDYGLDVVLDWHDFGVMTRESASAYRGDHDSYRTKDGHQQQ